MGRATRRTSLAAAGLLIAGAVAGRSTEGRTRGWVATLRVGSGTSAARVLEKIEERHEAAQKGAEEAQRLSISWSSLGTVRGISAWRLHLPIEGAGRDMPPERIAFAFLDELGPALGITSPAEALKNPRSSLVAETNETVVRFDQQVDGLPVWDAGAAVTIDAEGGVSHFNGLLVPDSALPPSKPQVNRETAVSKVLSPAHSVEAAELGFFGASFARDEAGPVNLAWRLRVVGRDEEAVPEEIFVDAVAGDILERRVLRQEGKHIETSTWDKALYKEKIEYDDQCHAAPGANACPAGWGCDPAGPCEDPAANWPGSSKQVSDHSHFIYDYFWNRYGRDSWDKNGGAIHVVANDGPGCAGYWQNLDKKVTLGTTSSCIDYLGHEFTHGLDQGNGDGSPTGGLLYGTDLSEGIPDSFGEFLEAALYGSADWVWSLGPGCPYADCLGAIRSLKNPIETGDVDNFANISPGSKHMNGTVIGKAAYLFGREPAAGSETHWGVPVTGVGEVNASKVWYHALTNCIGPKPTWTDWRTCIVTKACQMLDANGCLQAHNAMDAVGLWRPDTSVGWPVKGEVAYAYAPISGRKRYYILYQNPGSDNVYYRFRACSLTSNCPWSPAKDLLLSLLDAPASVAYKGTLYTCGPNASTQVVGCRNITSNGSLTALTFAGATSDTRVSMVEYDGHLYLFVKAPGVGAQPVKWYRYNGQNWYGPVVSPILTTAAPTAASGTMDFFGATKNGLWVVYQVQTASGPRIAYRRFDPVADSWSEEMLAGPPYSKAASTAAPAAAVWRGRLHIAARDANDAIWHMSCAQPCDTPETWTKWTKQAAGAQEGLRLDGTGGQLLLFHRPPKPFGNGLYYRFKVGE